MNEPLVYLWLGSAGSGRREIVHDVIEEGLEQNDRATVLLAEAAPAVETAFSRVVETGAWSWAAEDRIEAVIPEGSTHVFFIADGRANPVDQIEAFSKWLDGQPAELARVITVVDAQLCHKNPRIFGWYEACIHFSDMVLLNRREEVPQKWIAEFMDHFRKEHYPCLFELVKKNRVRNPALLLHPESRRISTIFDEFPWVEEDAEEEEEAESDRYLERLPSGRRVKEIPDISQFL